MKEEIVAELAPSRSLIHYYGLAAGFFLGSLVLITLGQLVLSTSGFLPEEMKDYSAWHLFAIVLVQALSSLSLFVFFVTRLKMKVFAFWREPIKPINLLGQAALALLGLWGVYIVVGLIFRFIGIDEIKQFEELNKQTLKDQALVFYFTVAVLAPIYEEIIFRGFILPSLLPENMGKYRELVFNALAVLVSSGLFALMHIQSGALATIPIFALAIYLSLIAIRKKSIYLCIIVHMFQNSLAAYFMLHQDEFKEMLKNLPQSLMLF